MFLRIVILVLCAFVSIHAQVGGSDPALAQNLPTWKNGKYNLEKIVTKGNASWAEIEIAGLLEKYTLTILSLVDDFQKSNPLLEVTGFQVQKKHTKYNMYKEEDIQGIWIFHKPKNTIPLCSK